MKQERRYLSHEFRVEAKEDGATPKIIGYAAKFSPARSEDLGSFVEEVDPHAFDACLADPNHECVGLFNHDQNIVLGRRSANTMSISVDSVGLKYEIDPPDTTAAKDLMISMRRGDVKSSSFGFYCMEDRWHEEKDGTLVRTILKASIFDCSPVVFPAYSSATSSLRSLFPEDKGEIPVEITEKIAEIRGKVQAEKRYQGVRSAVSSAKWAILPEKLETICALLDARAQGVSATKEEIRAAMNLQHGETPVAESVAVIPVYGVISQRMSMFDEFSGGASCEGISKSIKAALADDSVSSIVLDIDSPGGTVTGVPELAKEILEARGQKPIIAVANGMAASAAYWIASAADKIVVIPSGEVGSIGVYTTHQDVSAAMEKEGVKLTFIQAGKYKTEGNPYEALSDEAKADIQDGVDKFYDMFTSAVAEGRGVDVKKVLADFGQGRMKLAVDAVEAGMADEVATLEQVIAGLNVVKEASATVTQEGVEATKVADMSTCQCDCTSCLDGDCDGCGDDDCNDPFCGHTDEAKAAKSAAAYELRRRKLMLASLEWS